MEAAIGGGREDREDDEQDEGVPDVIPVTRKLHHLPSTVEQELHNRTHVPYRPWCPHCVSGRKVNWSHTAEQPRTSNAVPEVHLDYCFFQKPAWWEERGNNCLEGPRCKGAGGTRCAVQRR